ncbi:DUF4124 domain-containing protein [Pseudoxanthomonas wuyuanensis]|uniref:DUF4124 domain-containing protein n=1 Tax=Pseudoxanthomonas wuyuanensis TaxID=1073196 RepID=A0A286DC17_9GAMM|nr:DUF4124 domain-containing protein [Pseudoxanthomonas wuyuanensis]SOD56197.1 protein of unknown function [Pseudoxanthomonas wuyuanensis]
MRAFWAVPAKEARPSLLRWRNAAGALHITEQPPPDRPYQRIEREPTPAVFVQGHAGSSPAG